MIAADPVQRRAEGIDFVGPEEIGVAECHSGSEIVGAAAGGGENVVWRERIGLNRIDLGAEIAPEDRMLFAQLIVDAGRSLPKILRYQISGEKLAAWIAGAG